MDHNGTDHMIFKHAIAAIRTPKPVSNYFSHLTRDHALPPRDRHRHGQRRHRRAAGRRRVRRSGQRHARPHRCARPLARAARCARSASTASPRIGGARRAVSRAAPCGRMAEASAGKDSVTGPLGDDGHRARSRRFRCFPTGSRRRSSPSSRGRPAAACSATRPPPAPRSSTSSAPEHMRTGALIVYTSADSVFQIAAHEDDRAGARAVSSLRDRVRIVGEGSASAA